MEDVTQSQESSQENDKFELARQKFAEIAQKIILIDTNKFPYRQLGSVAGVFKKEDVKKYLKTPETESSQKQLRKVSRYLYNSSQQYKKAVDYYGGMLRYDYYIEPYDIDPANVDKDRFKKDYKKVSKVIETMNLKQEYAKINNLAQRDGIFFGYRQMGENSFFILPLDADYCKITGINDGCYQIAFNFAYFYSFPEYLNTFPPEFRTKFQSISDSSPSNKKKTTSYWMDLDINNTECITAGIDWTPIPPLIQLFDSVLDILDYKELDKIDKKISIYKLLHQKIPFGDGIDDFLLNAEKAKVYDSLLAGILPEDIGLLTSPMDIKEISFERDTVNKNKVSEATRQLWDDAAISHLLFSGESTSVGLNESIRADESPIFNILRQIERSINRYLKFNVKTKYKFRIKMLDSTRFNYKDVQKSLLESAGYGFSKLMYAASLGYEPTSVENMTFLENEILEMSNQLIPLKSPHTSATGNEGRPQSDNVGDSGLKQRDNLANE